jgi:hypothetical protein
MPRTPKDNEEIEREDDEPRVDEIEPDERSPQKSGDDDQTDEDEERNGEDDDDDQEAVEIDLEDLSAMEGPDA